MFVTIQTGFIAFVLLCCHASAINAAQVHLKSGEELLPHPQVLRIDLKSAPQCLDPNKVRTAVEAWVVQDLFEGLLIRDKTGQVIPGVAYAWEHKDYQVWTFYLRKAAKWSNNDPVTAHDFVFSFRRFSQIGNASAQELKTDLHLKNAGPVLKGQMTAEQLGIEALDDHTLRITLEQPVAGMLELLTSISLMPIHQRSAETIDAKKGNKPWALSISNGAYCAPVLYSNEKIRISRNNAYWDRKNTVISCVDYYFSKDLQTKFMHFGAGHMEIVRFDAEKEVYAELKKRHGSQVALFPTLSWQGIMLNTATPPFSNPALRKALNLTLDRKKLFEAVYGDKAIFDEVCYGLLPKVSIGQSQLLLPEWCAWPYEKRVKEARRLLKEAFGEKPLPILNFSYKQSADYNKIVEILAQTWKATLGLTVLTQAKSFDVINDALDSGQYEMSTSGFGLGNKNPISILEIFHPEGGQNYPNYINDAYAKLVEQASLSTNIQDVESLCNQANLMLSEDSPCLALCYCSSTFLISDYVRGFDPCNNTGYFYSKDLYLVKTPSSTQTLTGWSDVLPCSDKGRPVSVEQGSR